MRPEDGEINRDITELFNHLLTVVHGLSPTGRREMRKAPMRTIVLSPTAMLVGDVGFTRHTSLNRTPRVTFRYGDRVLAGDVYVQGSYVMHYLPVADSQNTDHTAARAYWPRGNVAIIFRRERGRQIVIIPTTEGIRRLFTKGCPSENMVEVAETHVYDGPTTVLLAKVSLAVNYHCKVVTARSAYEMMRQVLLSGAYQSN